MTTTGGEVVRPAPGSAPPAWRGLRRRRAGPSRTAVVVALAGVVLTGSVAWVALVLERRNEHSLLVVQAHQAATVIAGSVLTIEDPLSTALRIADTSGGDAADFVRYLTPLTGPGRDYVAAELFGAAGADLRLVAAVGGAPALSSRSGAGRALLRRAQQISTFAVAIVDMGGRERIAYAEGDGGDGRFVVYAERAIPPDRQVPVERGSAFADLDYATYVGAPGAADLATTDLAPASLPIPGYTATVQVPFGDTRITLVAAARGHLDGPLGASLPWIALGAGLAITVVSAAAADELVRRRLRAEAHAEELTGLYRQLDVLYAQQRGIAGTLQQALLPAYNPTIPGLEIASRYVAGTAGVDVGGDWYGVVPLGGGRFGFVVGDVSGRGVGAAVVMARMRFTIRAYLVEGHAPAAVLAMCSRQFDLLRDEHFATVLVGVGDATTGEITLANAGHLNPLVVSASRAEFVATDVGIPLGTGACVYGSTTVVVPAGATLLAFTDGLVERRREDIDRGLGRLRDAARALDGRLEERVAALVAALVDDASEDDVAVLALRIDAGADATPPPDGALTDEVAP